MIVVSNQIKMGKTVEESVTSLGPISKAIPDVANATRICSDIYNN